MRRKLIGSLRRYTKRYAMTRRPCTVVSLTSSVTSLITYIDEHYPPEVRSWSDLRRDPHIEGWLASFRDLQPATRVARIQYVRMFFADITAASPSNVG